MGVYCCPAVDGRAQVFSQWSVLSSVLLFEYSTKHQLFVALGGWKFGVSDDAPITFSGVILGNTSNLQSHG